MGWLLYSWFGRRINRLVCFVNELIGLLVGRLVVRLVDRLVCWLSGCVRPLSIVQTGLDWLWLIGCFPGVHRLILFVG